MVDGGILVLDDESSLRRAWLRWLSARRVACWCAGSPDEARAILARERVLAVIADFQLGASTSAPLLRDLRASATPPAIVVLTGDPEGARRELGPGWAILAKPVEPEDVIAALERSEPP